MEERRLIGEGTRFQRVRRITGYLVGTLERFNDAKRAEVRDRVTHDLSGGERERVESSENESAPVYATR